MPVGFLSARRRQARKKSDREENTDNPSSSPHDDRTHDQTLHSAAEHGPVERVAFLLRKGGSDINGALHGRHGLQPLHCAARGGKTDIVAFLLQNGADIHAAVPLGGGDSALHRYTPLQCAAWTGQFPTVALLLRQRAYTPLMHVIPGTCIESQQSKELTEALRLATLSGHTDVVKQLVQHGVDQNQYFESGATPLHLAARAGHLSLVEFFVDKAGVNIEKKASDEHERTALLDAAVNGRLEVVSYLAANGGDVRARDIFRRTALHYLSSSPSTRPRIVTQIIQQGASVSDGDLAGLMPIHDAARCGNRDVVQCLLDHGSDVDPLDARGNTPLHWASRGSHNEVVKCLIQHGANILALNESNWLSLHQATRFGNLELVAVLVEHNSTMEHLDQVNGDGKTALHLAACSKLTDISSCLIRAGASIDSVDRNGATALHHAAKTSDADTVAHLIQQGLRISAPARAINGKTPLHIAIVQGSLEVVACLLSNGASANEIDAQGYTALHFAVKRKALEKAKLLVLHGADPSIPSHTGLTPLHIVTARAFADRPDRTNREMINMLFKAAKKPWLEPTGFHRPYWNVMNLDIRYI